MEGMGCIMSRIGNLERGGLPLLVLAGLNRTLCIAEVRSVWSNFVIQRRVLVVKGEIQPSFPLVWIL